MTQPGQPPWDGPTSRIPARGPQQGPGPYPGQGPYPGPGWVPPQHGPPPPPPPSPPRGVPLRTKILLIGAAVVIGIAAGAVWFGLGRSGDAADGRVLLEPVAFAGDNPFLPPVGQDKADVTPPAAVTGTFSGDTAGLYADTDGPPSCDAPSLTSGLTGDPVKAAAWSSALGITQDAIPRFVTSLSPVVLRSDTAVTDYGFRAGTFIPTQAVLQAGTAVMINSYGEPTVKCFSGNPLSKPVATFEAARATYVGRTWTHWAPAHCTVIRPTTVIIKKYVFVNVEKKVIIERPGKPDPKPNPGPNPEPNPNPNPNPGPGPNPGPAPNPNPAPPPDPALEAAAKEAEMRAAMAGQAAADARSKADDAAVASRIFDTEARNLEGAAATKQAELAAAEAAFNNAQTLPEKVAAENRAAQARIEAQKAAEAAATARAAAVEKSNQAKNAEAAARSAEGARDIVDAEATDKRTKAGMPGATNGTPPTGNPPPAGKQVAGAGQNGEDVGGQDGDQAVVPPGGDQAVVPPGGDGAGGPGAPGGVPGAGPFMTDVAPGGAPDVAPGGAPGGAPPAPPAGGAAAPAAPPDPVVPPDEPAEDGPPAADTGGVDG